MSALSIPAVAGFGANSLVNSGISTAQQQKPVEPPVRSVENSASLPRFSSPHIYIDPTSNHVVFETRDAETGKLTNQLPSSLQLQAYRLQQSLTPAAPAAANDALTDKPIAASGKTVVAA